MGKLKKAEETFGMYKKPDVVYSVGELREFGKELQKYMVTKKISYPSEQEIEVLDVNRWLHDIGALKNGAVVINDLSRSGGEWDCSPIEYEWAMNKLEQYQALMAREKQTKSFEKERSELTKSFNVK